METENNI